MQSVFVFTLLAGFTVLLAAVQSSRDDRRYESAVLRTLGASAASWAGGAGGVRHLGGARRTACRGRGSTGGRLRRDTRVAGALRVGSWLPPLGIGGGALLVCLSGWLATRSVVSQPPMLTLRGE